MDSKSILGFFFVLFSWVVFQGSCQNMDQLIRGSDGQDLAKTLGGIVQTEGNGGDNAQTECVKKLLPCQPSLHSSSPSPTCCMPLKEMVTNDAQCLCGVISTPDLLKSFNITKDDALDLAKACGANPDLSVCRTAGSPTSSPASPTVPPNGSNSTNSSSSVNSPSDSSKKSAANGIIPSESFIFLVSLVAMLVLSF